MLKTYVIYGKINYYSDTRSTVVYNINWNNNLWNSKKQKVCNTAIPITDNFFDSMTKDNSVVVDDSIT